MLQVHLKVYTQVSYIQAFREYRHQGVSSALGEIYDNLQSKMLHLRGSKCDGRRFLEFDIGPFLRGNERV